MFRMISFLARNWYWIVFFGAFVWMHSRGYGCGMHGGHHHSDHQNHEHSERESSRS